MLRAASSICVETQALELVASARRDVFKLFRTHWSSTAARPAQTVLMAREAAGPTPPPQPPPPPPPPPPRTSRGWNAAAALAVAASLGGVYYYRRLAGDERRPAPAPATAPATATRDAPPPSPASADALPAHVQYLLVGAGTASFAAMRAIRSARPDAQVLLVGDEHELPYMRPPLSKELWREPALAAADLDALAFHQWNGKRRNVAYEPAAFYTPVERLAASGGGAAVARGWRVTKLDVTRREASLEAPGCAPATVAYDKVLVATGLRPRRAPALRPAAAAGRALPLRRLRDAARLAAAVDEPSVETVAVLGGGFLACELSAALVARLQPHGKRVLQVFREEAPMAAVLPEYLAREAARRLRRAGVTLLPAAEVEASVVSADGSVQLSLSGGGALAADLVVECVGSEVDEALARASGLETHAGLGGLLVNAELQARSDVYAAGDVACFYDVALGRRRVEHHDHAVVSGRLAGENMAAVGPTKHYTHQSMFWSDLGPDLGYEAIGVIDSRLPTVGVFSADAVSREAAAAAGGGGELRPAGAARAEDSRYERGVVFYVREQRVVGVLLWNLFNRMHVARQVLAQGHFEDLFEAAKLFSLHEDE